MMSTKHISPTWQTTAQLIEAANRDSDPVSCFALGSERQNVEGAILVVKGNKRTYDFLKLLEHQGLITPGKAVVDKDAPDAPAFDFHAHLQRQRDFSERTFGPGARVHGVTDHIAKELVEVRESGGDLKEWIDVVILALDGAWRSGATPQQIIDALVAKQDKNEARTWPDGRTADPDKAIEHDGSGETPA